MNYANESQISTSTLEFLFGKTVDTITSYSPATLFFLANQSPWKGSQFRISTKYVKNTQGTWFTGLDKFSTTKTDNFINMTFNPTGREIPVVINQMEVDINATNRIIDIVARQLASDAQDMAVDVASSFYTLQTGNAFLSLKDACDDGSLGATTYGGLTRSTYTGVKGNYASIGGNLTLANMTTSFNASTHGPDSPNLILCDKTVWGYYEKLLTPTLSTQAMSTALIGYPKFTGATAGGVPNIVAPGTDLKAGQGFTAIYYKGVPLIADEQCSSGYMYMLNTRTISFYGIKSTDPEYKTVNFYSDAMDGVYNVPAATGFAFSGFNKPVDQYGKVGHILLMGNLICKDPRKNAVMIGITGA